MSAIPAPSRSTDRPPGTAAGAEILQSLKRATRERHAALERRLPLLDPQLSRANGPAVALGQNICRVGDDDIGIEPRHFDPLFRMFRRPRGHDEFGGGLGAGLMIVEKLVQRHGGRIRPESAPCAGSSFYFTLAPQVEALP